MENVGENLNLFDLVQQKEKEWKDAQELRVKSLQISLKEQQQLLNNERTRFRKLKEDFEYNLKLLGERDAELERYDVLFAKYKHLESDRDGEVSELKIKLDEQQSILKQEQNANEELKNYYQQRLKEHQNEMQQFVIAKECEVKTERDKLEKFKRDLQLQVRSAEEDFDRQRQLIMTGYDDELHKRDHEYRIKTDELRSKLLEQDLKVKMLTKEVEILRSYDEQAKNDIKTTETLVQNLEKKLKQKELEIIDNENMHNAKIADMERELLQLTATMKKSQQTFQHKHNELDRYAKEKETALISSKEAHEHRERQLEQGIHELQNKLDTAEVECRRIEWEAKDSIKNKEIQLNKLYNTVSELENKLSAQETKFSQSSVSKDMEMNALREQKEKLQNDILQKTADIERYKKDVSMAAEREAHQEQIKSQIELDWQMRCEDVERQVYEKQENLIKNLTKTKDKAVATVTEKERELEQREHLIRILTESRDQALATLKRHGLSIPTELPSKEGPGENMPYEEQLKVYQEQNRSLRDVIRQMRQEMEELNNQLASRPPSIIVPDDPGNASVPVTSEYVKSLEKEIRDLKSKNRNLCQRLEELPLLHKPPSGTGNEQARSLGKIDDPYVQSHVKELNDTIGVLRQDKIQLTAESKKHQASIEHLRNLLTQAQDQTRQKQLSIDQAQYQLSSLTRRSTEEINSLKQRVSELELLLTQVRREADEYFKNGLERNLEATTLGNQLSVLKLELASQGRSTSSFNPHTEVDKQQQRTKNTLPGQAPRLYHDTDVARLQAKLKTAAQRISQLVREKDQLIQMGNKLRAELSRHKASPMDSSLSDKNSSSFSSSKPTKVSEMTDELRTKLSAMEKLQYALTTHELQVAQRMAEQQKATAGRIQVNVRSSSSESSPRESNDVIDTEKPRSQRGLSNSKGSSPNHSLQRKDPEPANSHGHQRSSSPHHDHALFTSSSEGHGSIQEVWKLLEEEESFRTLSPIREQLHDQSPADIPVREESEESSGFTVKGKKTQIDSKVRKQKTGLSKRAMGKIKSTPKKPSIRNYNVRDDQIWNKPQR